MASVTSQLEKEWSRIQSDPRFANVKAQQPDLKRLCLASPWFTTWLQKQSDWASVVSFVVGDKAEMVEELAAKAQHWSLTNEIQVMQDLRIWRNRHMARLIARDILGLSQVRLTASALSDMADTAVHYALNWSQAYWSAKEGEPGRCPISGAAQQLIVIAMGKHGAQELNLSSDIDLIFAYSATGKTEKGKELETFFTRVGRKLIQLLDVRTADGFVFRVDMRLRPWGQSGALVPCFAALQNYYLQQGRFWERYALVKARVITGHQATQKALSEILKPFVYRRYIDFQAVGALRELKSKIQTEVRRQNLGNHIKLGAGGIREVEFVAQVFQLVRGGKDESLQVRGTWPALAELAHLNLLSVDVVTELLDAYDFLRDLEHRIQAIRDEQTQSLPADELDQARIALSLGLPGWDDVMSLLQGHRERVEQHFQQLIAESSEEHHQADDCVYSDAWQHRSVVSEEVAIGLSDALNAFRDSKDVARLSGVAEQNFSDFMPALWRELDRYRDGESRFQIIRPIIEAILRRTSYFSLLFENRVAIKELVKLAPASEWIANLLREKPYLLDELTDQDSLYRLPLKEQLRDELHQMLLRVPEDDLERQMETLRHFRHGRVLRAAACEVSQHLPLMKISDYLAWVAEVVVEQALAVIWRQMVAVHGRPSKASNDWCDMDFGVVAYGKMGGIELSYESDLDLVFLHNASAQGMTEGPKSIENGIFMTRLAQKLIYLLSALTPSGMLYEIDTRLRPSGNSGLLVSSLPAFWKYQQEKAWTWEHQALVRARFIAGDVKIKHVFEDYRQKILCEARDPDTLKADVKSMRQKMLEHLSSTASGSEEGTVFHIKHDPGGIVDIEFLVQYLVLANAHSNADLVTWTDNVRLIEQLQKAGVISDLECQQFLKAYLDLREMTHHAILSSSEKVVPMTQLSKAAKQAREVVKSAWQKYLE